MLFDGGCVVCGQAAGPVCPACQALLVRADAVVVPGLDICRVGYALDDRCRTIIAALKYRRHRRIAAWLARAVGDLVPRGVDAITWVPATPERRRSRGFDQAREIARELSAHSAVPTLCTLDRHAGDQRQTGLSRQDRLHGPTLSSRGICPPVVAVVDDVVTTGSSLSVAAEQLRSAGARRVVGVVVAATPLDREIILHGVENASIIRKWT